MTELRTHLNKNQKCLNDITQEKGVSNWLAPYLISNQDYDLNRQGLWDCVRFHHDLV